MRSEPITLGLISDVQYADCDDKVSENRTQRFREVPGKLEAALSHFAETGCDAVIHLGDIIQSESDSKEQTLEEFESIERIFASHVSEIPVIHVLGNHCIATLGRECIMKRLNIPEPGYYCYDLSDSWRLVVLDTTEMSGHSMFPEDSWQIKESQEYVANHPCSEEDPHMVFWNGGITSTQLQWLQSQVTMAEESSNNLIVLAHHQVCLDAARRTHLAWNFRDIFRVLSQSPAVRFFFAGHDHVGGYKLYDPEDQHYITMPGLVEAPSSSNAFGTLHIHSANHVELKGYGTVPSRNFLR